MSDAVMMDNQIVNPSAGPPGSNDGGLDTLPGSGEATEVSSSFSSAIGSSPPSPRRGDDEDKNDIQIASTVKPFRKGWAKGEQADFLDQSYHGYQAARSRGSHHIADFVTATVNSYCSHFTWWLDPPQMPTADELAKEDEDLSPALYSQKAARLKRITVGIKNYMERLSSRAVPITLMSNKQIEKDPIASLIATVGNAKYGQRRARTGYQLWSMSNFKTKVKKEVDDHVLQTGADAQKDRIGVVQGQILDAYDALPADVRQKYEDESQQEKEELKQRKKDQKYMPQRLDPENVQLALDRLPGTLITLFDGLRALTGWNFDVFYSGPNPRAAGQITTLSIHSGVDRGPTPCDFATAGGAEGLARRRLVEAAIGDFALRCFSTADRQAFCLPDATLNQTPPGFLAWRPDSWQGAMKRAVTAVAPSAPSVPVKISRKRKKASRSQAGSRKKKGASVDCDLSDSSDSDDDDVVPGAVGKNADVLRGSDSSMITDDVDCIPVSHLSNATAAQRPQPSTLATEVSHPAQQSSPLDDITSFEFSPTIPILGPSDAPTGPAQSSISSSGVATPVLPPFPEEIDIPIDPALLPALPPSPTTLPSREQSLTSTAPVRRSTRKPSTTQAVNKDTIPASKVTTRSAKPTRLPAAKVQLIGKGPVVVPAYIENAPTLFAGVGRETSWDDCVALYLKYERTRGYAGRQLATGRRPPSLVRHVKGARVLPQDRVLPLLWPETVEETQGIFWEWWRWLQPDWRDIPVDDSEGNAIREPLMGTSRSPPPDDVDWSGLDSPGINGFYNVMTYMFFWGRQVDIEDEGQEHWREALEDVQWVLASMCGKD